MPYISEPSKLQLFDAVSLPIDLGTISLRTPDLRKVAKESNTDERYS